MNDTDEMSEDPAKRSSRLLSRLQDPTLLVLKGHLLIEEQLDRFLELAAKAPGELNEARLTFAQKLQLVRALSGITRDELDFARAINKIRNALAHRADADDLPEQIDKLLWRFNEAVPRELTRRQRASWLRVQMVFVCGAINGMASMFQVVQANIRLHPMPPRRSRAASRRG